MEKEIKMNKKNKEPRLYTFRIKYNPGASRAAQNSYHYFQAVDADQALQFHKAMMSRKKFQSQTIGVERKDPYANKWIQEHPASL